MLDVMAPFSQKALFATETFVAKRLRNSCQVAIGWQDVILPLTFAFPKESSYFELLNYGLLRRLETGFFAYLSGQYFNSGYYVPCSEQKEGTSLGFHKLLGSFATLGCGIFAAYLLHFHVKCWEWLKLL